MIQEHKGIHEVAPPGFVHDSHGDDRILVKIVDNTLWNLDLTPYVIKVVYTP
jgi:hypothetical protein